MDLPDKKIEAASDENKQLSSSWEDRITIGIICAPLAYLSGRSFFYLLLNGLSPRPNWFEQLVTVIVLEVVAAVLLLTTSSTLWAVTGLHRFSQRAWSYVWKFLLVTIGGSIIIMIVSALVR